MKKIYPKLLFFLLPILSHAQLHIQKNALTGSTDQVFIYNSGELLYVEKEINLKDGSAEEVSGNIYLRDGGQLIQGDENAKNSGTGIVSIYQDGTANQWDYHFWGSPVGNPMNESLTAANPGNGSLTLSGKNSSDGMGGGLFSPTDILTSNPATFFGPPNYDGIPANNSNPVIIASYWLNKYTNSSGYYGWQNIRETGVLNAGEGFTMKGVGSATTTLQRYDFRGRPNNGTISVPVGNNQNTLVGNPYPSAMDLDFFLISNSTSGNEVESIKPGATPVGNNITGIAYFWESDPNTKSHNLRDYLGGYGAYSPLSGSPYGGIYQRATYSKYNGDGTTNTDKDISEYENNSKPVQRYIPVGQGFFVKGNSSLFGPSFVQFNNEFRVFKKKDEESVSEFKSVIKNESTAFSSNQVAASTVNKNKELRITTSINDTYIRDLLAVFYERSTDNFDSAADAENISFLKTDVSYYLSDTDKPYNINALPLDLNKEIPLILNAGANENFYSMKVSDINFESKGIWLWDKELNQFHDIKKNAYEFSLPKGTYKERFAIVFNDDSEILAVAEEIKKSMDVIQNNRQSQLQVINPLLEDLREVSVYNLLGKQVTHEQNAGRVNNFKISSANWSDGIYIVRVITEDNISFSKKVSVTN